MASFLSRLFDWDQNVKSYETLQPTPPPLLLPPIMENIKPETTENVTLEDSTFTQTEAGISTLKNADVSTEPFNIEVHCKELEKRGKFGEKIDDPFKRLDYFVDNNKKEENRKYGYVSKSHTAKSSVTLPKVSESIVKSQMSASKPHFTFKNKL